MIWKYDILRTGPKPKASVCVCGEEHFVFGVWKYSKQVLW